MIEAQEKTQAGFITDEIERVSLDKLEIDTLEKAMDFWRENASNGSLPLKENFDPITLKDVLGRLHLVEVEGPGQFRFRVYGSGVVNPDKRDMTGRTTLDYEDTGFGAMVTAHYQEAVDGNHPVCHHIKANLNDMKYEYRRLIMPMAAEPGGPAKYLLVASARYVVPIVLTDHRTGQNG